MSEPSLDLEKPNAVGALDRITTNVAISLIAVVPTLVFCIVTPWRLAGLLMQDNPEGRSGMLLAPGAFFPLSLLISLMLGALLTTPEIADNNGAFLGPGLALAIQSAVAEGNVWKTVATVMPIYGFAVLAGTLGLILKPLAGRDWTLRVSLRAVFYVTGVFVSWIILTTAAIDLTRAATQNADLINTLYMLIPLPTLAGLIWMYLWFFRKIGNVSYFRGGLLGFAMVLLKFPVIIALGTLAAI